jgi:hypothetical protein
VSTGRELVVPGQILETMIRSEAEISRKQTTS